MLPEVDEAKRASIIDAVRSAFDPFVHARNSGEDLVGVEFEEASVARARQHVEDEGLGDRIRIVQADVSKLTDGILVTTRPALNILAAHAAPKGVILVAQEHMNLASHRDDVRAAIVRLYPRFHAVVVLTNTDRSDYEKVLPGTRIVRIPATPARP